MKVFSWSPLTLEAAFENCCYFHHAVKQSILTWCAQVGGWPAPSVLPVGTSSLTASQVPSWAWDHSTTCWLPEDNSGISLGCPGCRHWPLPSKQEEKKGRCWLAWSVVLVLPPGKIMWYDCICQHGNCYSRVGKKEPLFPNVWNEH